MVRFIDTRARGMLLADKRMLKNCPTSWQEPGALDILAQITRLYKREVQVDLNAVLAVALLMSTLGSVEKRTSEGTVPAPEKLKKVLRVLEDICVRRWFCICGSVSGTTWRSVRRRKRIP
ncbi:hypothetical protein EDD15DRAFT_2292696 [Pisolithus albus]|nr:hypothetical protein EDD15DRAFT_2292696 [Pisolithus albus]